MKIIDLIEAIKNKFPEIDFIDKSDSENMILEFKSKFQKDYYYSIWLGIKSIGATVSAKLWVSEDYQYFWYIPFDPYGSDTKEEKINDCLEAVLDELKIITRYKTRIIQKKGCISQTFICEFFKDNKWNQYKRTSALRTNFKFPLISGKMKIYI